MSCNSAILCVNSNDEVPANGTIPVGSVVRRFGRFVNIEGGGVSCCGVGYYAVDCSVTLVPAGAGDIGIQVYADGAAIPGATATGTGVAGSPLSLSVTTLVRQRCCGATTLTVGLASPADATTGATVQNMSVRVEKV